MTSLFVSFSRNALGGAQHVVVKDAATRPNGRVFAADASHRATVTPTAGLSIRHWASQVRPECNCILALVRDAETPAAGRSFKLLKNLSTMLTRCMAPSSPPRLQRLRTPSPSAFRTLRLQCRTPTTSSHHVLSSACWCDCMLVRVQRRLNIPLAVEAPNSSDALNSTVGSQIIGSDLCPMFSPR